MLGWLYGRVDRFLFYEEIHPAKLMPVFAWLADDLHTPYYVLAKGLTSDMYHPPPLLAHLALDSSARLCEVDLS